MKGLSSLIDMTKFGVFNHGDTEPLQVYEGDCFASTPPYTTVIVYSKDGGSLREVALIHVADGQSMKEISPPTGPARAYSSVPQIISSTEMALAQCQGLFSCPPRS